MTRVEPGDFKQSHHLRSFSFWCYSSEGLHRSVWNTNAAFAVEEYVGGFIVFRGLEEENETAALGRGSFMFIWLFRNTYQSLGFQP